MSSAIAITMDASGRLVLPKAVREAAGLEAGMPLAISVNDGRIEIEPAPRAVKTVRRGRFAIAVALEEGPTLTARTVRETQSVVRRER
ncbi:MAG: AbrB/MazE/SpoVT family DNA-binding domain-containing protein [Thermoanaerobaculia bacterium]